MLKFSTELANKIDDKTLYVANVNYDTDQKYIVKMDAMYFDIEDTDPKERPTMHVSLTRDDVIWLLANDYYVLVLSSVHESLSSPEAASSALFQYKHPLNGKTCISNRPPCDDIELPKSVIRTLQ